jgi:hypothetical protein
VPTLGETGTLLVAILEEDIKEAKLMYRFSSEFGSEYAWVSESSHAVKVIL